MRPGSKSGGQVNNSNKGAKYEKVIVGNNDSDRFSVFLNDDLRGICR